MKKVEYATAPSINERAECKVEIIVIFDFIVFLRPNMPICALCIKEYANPSFLNQHPDFLSISSNIFLKYDV
jgi:hypothetical protein